MAYRTGSVTERNHAETHTELLVRFAVWAQALGRVPLPEEIANRFHVSHATAYRWRIAYCDATGMERPAPRLFGETNWLPHQRPHPRRRQPTRDTDQGNTL